MAKKEFSELKKRAMLAKQRMRMGYWQKLREERERVLNEVGYDEATKLKISEIQRARWERDNNSVINRPLELSDEGLYQKVCEILDKDEDTPNPIGQLIEKEKIANYDDNEKQCYVLQLCGKYRELRERYYKERINKSC